MKFTPQQKRRKTERGCFIFKLHYYGVSIYLKIQDLPLDSCLRLLSLLTSRFLDEREREREEGQTFRIKLRHFLSLLFSLSWVYTPPYNLPEKVIGVINVLRDATSSRCRNRFCLLHHSRERFPAQKVAQSLSLSLLCVCF